MSLREVVILLRSVAPNLRSPGNAKLAIRHVYRASESDPDSWSHKDLGFVFARDLAGKFALYDQNNGGRGGRNDPSLKTLDQHRFVPGDFLDIAYMTGPGGPGGPGAGNGNIIPSIRGAAAASSLSSSLSALPGRNGVGVSEADEAWGIAGDRAIRGRGRGAGSGPSGSNRFNPLLSGRGGMSIMGVGRRGPPAADTANSDRRDAGMNINGRARRESRRDGTPERED